MEHEERSDPVCGMTVSEETAAAKTDFNGQVYWFCSEGCKHTFDEDPGRFERRDP